MTQPPQEPPQFPPPPKAALRSVRAASSSAGWSAKRAVPAAVLSGRSVWGGSQTQQLPHVSGSPLAP
jgi:hypothetical protein